MTDITDESIADRVDNKIVDLVQGELKQISGGDPYLTEAIMKIAIRSICHELLVMGADAGDLADHLDVMAGVMRDKQEEIALDTSRGLS